MQSSKGEGTPRFIGIDGGGTKTSCLIGDEYGNILAYCVGDSGNVNSRSWQEVRTTLIELIHKCLYISRSESSQLSGIYLGLAGSDRATEKELISKDLSGLFPVNTAITINNDAVTALAAGTWGGAGIVLIAGTGSIAYGYSPSTGASVRVGGWGHIFGDEGSGYDLGKKALTAVVQQYDGYGRITLLTNLILSRLGLQEPAGLINIIYHAENPRKTVADLSVVVMEAARLGDTVALEIVEHSISNLISLVRSAKTKLFYEAEELPLILNGGLFSDHLFESSFLARVNMLALGLQPRKPNFPASVGAYMLALLKRKKDLDNGVKIRIEATWEQIKDSV
ncbi:N-acetylglucosamine kinase [Paenibacillus sp. LjRoot56]|uniref:N-acetylglucosamine kinase n=1 Tax=Paenibacillus sp. LjRoot56 TaxID=3342333 RepID=UPI003ECEF0C2